MNTKLEGMARRGAGAGCVLVLLAACLGGCSQHVADTFDWLPFVEGRPPLPAQAEGVDDYTYIIGPGDQLNVFVWRNPELSTSVAVRPDGKFSTSLVENLEAAGKTPSELSREIEAALSEYIRDPLVTVTVGGFVGEYYEQIRVVGEAANPASIPYRKNMSVLDVMIAVGGITEFAAGNRASIIRTSSNGQEQFRVRLEDLVKDGDITANAEMKPGDILIIPEAWF